MKEYYCKCCASLVERDAVGLYKKLVDDKAKKFLCYPCLANHVDTTIEDLKEIAKELKEKGCKLFT